MYSSFWESGLKIPGIPEQNHPPHILSKTMPKVACWPNELRWIMVFENVWMVPFIISVATEMQFPAVPVFTLTGLCIKILTGQKWEERPCAL